MECFLKSDGFEGCFASKLVPKSTFRLPYVIETEKATYEELYFEIHMNRYGTAESRGRKINMKIIITAFPQKSIKTRNKTLKKTAADT